MSNIASINVSKQKGTVKAAVPSAMFEAGHGIVGDAHAGPGHRQVSILAQEDIDEVAASGVKLKPGAFGENLALSGVRLRNVGIGTRLEIGSVELVITQIGKKCHSRCAINTQTGDCIMPREGLFAEVIRSGEVRKGDEVVCSLLIPRSVAQVGVITVSDRCAAGERVNGSGPIIVEMLKRELGANIAVSSIVPDEFDQIAGAISGFADRGLDFVFTTGGTGIAPRDVTPQATMSVIDFMVPGIPEAMRIGSLQSSPRAMMSRAVAGVRGRCLIVNLPGAPNGVRQKLQILLPILSHSVMQLRGERDHPGD